jgi:hypothetical protein
MIGYRKRPAVHTCPLHRQRQPDRSIPVAVLMHRSTRCGGSRGTPSPSIIVTPPFASAEDGPPSLSNLGKGRPTSPIHLVFIFSITSLKWLRFVSTLLVLCHHLALEIRDKTLLRPAFQRARPPYRRDMNAAFCAGLRHRLPPGRPAPSTAPKGLQR